jgi:hypothetical protein
MLSNFEITMISLLAVNILVTVYYNYHSEEDYNGGNKGPRTKRPEETKKKK